MGVPYIAMVMSLSRFEEIRKNLYFCDNESQPSPTSPTFDRAFKIRLVMNHFNSCFQSSMKNTMTQAIDEHMIKFKGHNIMKQYMQNKPIKRGFKIWCRANSSTGYLFQIDLCTGKKKSGPEVGLGESLVLELIQDLVGLGCEIYFDNFFNSPMLQHKLAKKNKKACGTMRIQRKNTPKNLSQDKSMKRGDIYVTCIDGIYFIKLMDNKAVISLPIFVTGTYS
ncbi:piggyBac transposable element-derived protein 2-like [Eupeodes corollae]|uniref:piggyBac transposable element-derived protein 2-like n=1 Tax=Eupeodes corollae TaxID=290404 RepID=UPI0024918DF4|nr:piggyBac transposable element-derived protein 2-like [Eupeodes corollae]